MADSIHGYTTLMIKVEEGNLREVKAARQKNLKENINFQNKAGQSALTIAARSGFCEIAEYLIMEGADVNLINKAGQSPLFLACWYKRIQMVKLLIDYHADINLPDTRGWTPLMVACHNTNYELIYFLLSCNADVRCIDRFGKKASDRVVQDKELLKILDDIEEKQYELQKKQEGFMTPKRDASRSRGRSTGKKALSRSSSFMSPGRTPKTQDTTQRASRSPRPQIEGKSDTSPMRSCPKFVHDMEIYKMHEKVGYYEYFRKRDRSTKSKRKNSKGSIGDFSSPPRSVSCNRESIKSVKSPPKSDMTMGKKHRNANTYFFNDQFEEEFKETPKRKSSHMRGSESDPKRVEPLKIIDLGRSTTYPTQESEMFCETLRELDRFRGEVSGKKDRNMPSTMRSLGSTMMSLDDSRSKNVGSLGNLSGRNADFLSSRGENGSLNWLSTREDDNGDEVLNGEMKEEFVRWIKDLANRMHKVLNKRVKGNAENEAKQYGPVPEDRLHEIIMESGADLLDQTIGGFKRLVDELMQKMNLSSDFLGAVGGFTQGLIENTGRNSVENYRKSVAKELGRSPRKNTFSFGEAPISIMAGGLDVGNGLNGLKDEIIGQLGQAFGALDQSLAGKNAEEKGEICNFFRGQAMENLENLKNCLKALEGGDQGEMSFSEQFDSIQKRLDKLSTNLKKKPMSNKTFNLKKELSNSSRRSSKQSVEEFDVNNASFGRNDGEDSVVEINTGERIGQSNDLIEYLKQQQDAQEMDKARGQRRSAIKKGRKGDNGMIREEDEDLISMLNDHNDSLELSLNDLNTNRERGGLNPQAWKSCQIPEGGLTPKAAGNINFVPQPKSGDFDIQGLQGSKITDLRDKLYKAAAEKNKQKKKDSLALGMPTQDAIEKLKLNMAKVKQNMKDLNSSRSDRLNLSEVQSETPKAELVMMKTETLSFVPEQILTFDICTQTPVTKAAEMSTQTFQAKISDMAMQTEGVKASEIATQTLIVKTSQMSIQTEKEKVHEIETQTEGVKASEIAVQTVQAKICEMAMQTEGVKASEIATQTLIVKTSQMSIQTEKERCHEISIQTEKEKSYEISVQTEKEKSYEISVQTEKEKSYEISVQTERDGGHEMSVQTERESGHEISIQTDRENGHEMSVQTENETGKNISTEIETQTEDFVEIQKEETANINRNIFKAAEMSSQGAILILESNREVNEEMYANQKQAEKQESRDMREEEESGEMVSHLQTIKESSHSLDETDQISPIQMQDSQVSSGENGGKRYPEESFEFCKDQKGLGDSLAFSEAIKEEVEKEEEGLAKKEAAEKMKEIVQRMIAGHAFKALKEAESSKKIAQEEEAAKKMVGCIEKKMMKDSFEVLKALKKAEEEEAKKREGAEKMKETIEKILVKSFEALKKVERIEAEEECDVSEIIEEDQERQRGVALLKMKEMVEGRLMDVFNILKNAENKVGGENNGTETIEEISKAKEDDQETSEAENINEKMEEGVKTSAKKNKAKKLSNVSEATEEDSEEGNVENLQGEKAEEVSGVEKVEEAQKDAFDALNNIEKLDSGKELASDSANRVEPSTAFKEQEDLSSFQDGAAKNSVIHEQDIFKNDSSLLEAQENILSHRGETKNSHETLQAKELNDKNSSSSIKIPSENIIIPGGSNTQTPKTHAVPTVAGPHQSGANTPNSNVQETIVTPQKSSSKNEEERKTGEKEKFELPSIKDVKALKFTGKFALADITFTKPKEDDNKESSSSSPVKKGGFEDAFKLFDMVCNGRTARQSPPRGSKQDHRGYHDEQETLFKYKDQEDGGSKGASISPTGRTRTPPKEIKTRHIMSNEEIALEHKRRSTLTRSSIAKNVRSFSAQARTLIPLPSPSRFVNQIKKMRIDTIPLSEDFHYTGQKRNRGASMSVNRETL